MISLFSRTALNLMIQQLDWLPAQETLIELKNHTINIKLTDIHFNCYVTFSEQHPIIANKVIDEPDCIITMKTSEALKLALGQSAKLSFSGDIHVVTMFKNLVKQASFSMDVLLQRWLPEPMVFPAQRLVSALDHMLSQTKANLEEQFSHFIVNEMNYTPSAQALKNFSDKVITLRERIDRIEALIKHQGLL